MPWPLWLLTSCSDQVVVSASPTGEFDAPEDASLWGLKEESNEPIDLIVRPAHVELTFSQFMSLLRRNDLNASSLYLEYFPMFAAFQSCGGAGNKECDELLRQLPDYSFASFLSKRYHLLWMGGGGCRGDPDSVGTPSSSGWSCLPNSRMHYDRMENLMTVLVGSKTFHLYDPSQSHHLHGGEGVLSAAFSATVRRTEAVGKRKSGVTRSDKARSSATSGDEMICQNETDTCSAAQSHLSAQSPIDIVFHRDPAKLITERNTYHTYSPVNIRKPNLTRYPRFEHARGMQCTVHAGDTIFVPAHWWHEVWLPCQHH